MNIGSILIIPFLTGSMALLNSIDFPPRNGLGRFVGSTRPSSSSSVNISYLQRRSVQQPLSSKISSMNQSMKINLTLSTNRMRIAEGSHRYNPMRDVSGKSAIDHRTSRPLLCLSIHENTNQSDHHRRDHHQFYHVDHCNLSISVSIVILLSVDLIDRSNRNRFRDMCLIRYACVCEDLVHNQLLISAMRVSS